MTLPSGTLECEQVQLLVSEQDDPSQTLTLADVPSYEWVNF